MLIIIDRAFGTGGEEEEGPIHRFWHNLLQQNLIFSNSLYIPRTSYGSALQQKGCAMSTLGLSWKICESSLLPLGTQPQDFLRCEKAYKMGCNLFPPRLGHGE